MVAVVLTGGQWVSISIRSRGACIRGAAEPCRDGRTCTRAWIIGVRGEFLYESSHRLEAGRGELRRVTARMASPRVDVRRSRRCSFGRSLTPQIGRWSDTFSFIMGLRRRQCSVE